MRIDILVPAVFVGTDDVEIDASERHVEAPQPHPSLASIALADHVDEPLAERGLTGGSVSARAVAGAWRLCVSYRAPQRLSDADCASLLDEVGRQMSDGIGEGGIDFVLEGRAVVAHGSEDPGAYECVQIDDGVHVPAPSRVAMAAWKGMRPELEAALDAGESADGVYQGYPALSLAILRGDGDAALRLLSAGARVDVVDPTGDGPIAHCALSRTLSDEQAAAVARELLRRGATVPVADEPGAGSLVALALDRGKLLLASVLADAAGARAKAQG